LILKNVKAGLSVYLYIGQETVIKTSNIVGIFDLESTSVSRVTKEYLKKSQDNGDVVTVSQELPKSFIVCKERKRQKLYISQISTTTLKKRYGQI